jgi:hypothetical protein
VDVSPITDTPLMRAYIEARQTGIRWVTPADQQARLDRRSRNRAARRSRRVNRRH